MPSSINRQLSSGHSVVLPRKTNISPHLNLKGEPMDDYNVEITDLHPQDQMQPASKPPEAGKSVTSLLRKAWVWRLGIVIGSLLLSFLVIISSFPTVRNRLTHLLFGPGQPPAPGTIYINAYANNLYALRTKDGSIFWHYQTQGSILTSPIMVNGVVF